MLDPAYSQLLDTNQELRSELRDEIFINKSNEKKIRSLVKELEECYRIISFQDNSIIAHEGEIVELKSQISDLRKQLRILQQDKKFKDGVGSIQDSRIIELENKVERLKARIRILIDKKIPIDNLDMATADLIGNINRGLNRIEDHIGGVGIPIQNPANVLDGIRGSLNTIRVTLQNITAERDQYQNILNDTNNREQDLRNQLGDSRNQNLRLQRLLDESRIQAERITEMHTDALNDENRQVEDLRNQLRNVRNQYTNAYWGLRNNWQLAQNRQERIGELLRKNFVFRLLIQRKDTQIAEHRGTAHRLTVRYNNDTERWRRRHAGCVRQAQNWKGQYRNSQNQVQARDQNILNLQGQILALQNNPLGNMAAVHEIYQMLAPALGQIPNYIGKETPDEYIQKITNVFQSANNVITAANNANAGTFVDADKCDILKSKMGDKFSPVPANDPYTAGTPAINTPAIFTVWLRHKYREIMAGNAELALQSLIQERFNHSTDSPDVYESRIRKHIVGFADDQVLPALYTHLPPDLRNSVKIYMAIRGAGFQTVDNFFADLRKCWVERQVGPNMFSQNQIQPQVSYQGATSADLEKLNSKIASLEAQLVESMQVHSKLAQRLQLPENVVNSNNASIFDSYLNQELEKRLGVIEINLAKLIREDTKSAQYRYSESSDYNNGGLEKRLEQIEAHLAKFARKDTKGAKTPQRQRSESLPFGGLEKRLGQIEALLAKLAKDSKSRSGRVHMATADEQSNPIFSDDDTSKPEDNDYNSDNSSAGSDSEKHDTHVYINYGKKK